MNKHLAKGLILMIILACLVSSMAISAFASERTYLEGNPAVKGYGGYLMRKETVIAMEEICTKTEVNIDSVFVLFIWSEIN